MTFKWNQYKIPQTGETMISQLEKDLNRLADKERAQHSQRYFKTGPGEYGEGDVFIGIKVPELRRLARQYRNLKRSDLTQLLKSKVHEKRLLALLILVHQFETGNDKQRENIYNYYLKNTRYINNWDLVDSSAHRIVGVWLLKRDKSILKALTKSASIWERRIAIIACFHFIAQEQYGTALQIARQLLKDEHDIIHKAVGWMLREIGKRDLSVEEAFLQQHYHKMPRTMLRYAIERFPEKRRKAYLNGGV